MSSLNVVYEIYVNVDAAGLATELALVVGSMNHPTPLTACCSFEEAAVVDLDGIGLFG